MFSIYYIASLTLLILYIQNVWSLDLLPKHLTDDLYYVESINSAQNEKFLPRILPTKSQRHNIKDDKELECQVRQLAYSYAQQIQPFRGSQKDTFDALNINNYCGSNSVHPTTLNNNMIYHSNKDIYNAASEYTIYIDPVNGNDNNSGTKNAPLLTIYAALAKLRSYQSNQAIKQIIIRTGTIYLNSTIKLSPTTFDNNLLIRSYPNENVTISGGILLKINSFN
eukprot:471030_1